MRINLLIQFQWIVLLVIALFSFGCTNASPESRAGEWDVVTDFGELTLVVDPSGTTITNLKYRVQPCISDRVLSNDPTFVGDIEISNSSPITSAGGFYFDIIGVPEMTIKGYFNKSGTRITGEWNCGCREEWTSKR